MERIKTDQEINRPAISSFAEADLSLAARLLSKFKQIRFNLFSYLQGNDYTLALPINSPPGAQGDKHAQGETHDRRKRTPQAETSSRELHKQRLLHDALCVLEFRDF